MSRSLVIQNRQRDFRVDTRRLRRLTLHLLDSLLALESYDLGVSVVAAAEMTRINETFLQHAGSTDVITFDYADPPPRGAKPGVPLQGELILCVDEARIQAGRFHTTWQSELLRYIVHGVLHLQGYDDHRAGDRRRMKREEDRLVGLLEALA